MLRMAANWCAWIFTNIYNHQGSFLIQRPDSDRPDDFSFTTEPILSNFSIDFFLTVEQFFGQPKIAPTVKQ